MHGAVGGPPKSGLWRPQCHGRRLDASAPQNANGQGRSRGSATTHPSATGARGGARRRHTLAAGTPPRVRRAGGAPPPSTAASDKRRRPRLGRGSPTDQCARGGGRAGDAPPPAGGDRATPRARPATNVAPPPAP
eukprot:TRINITY_DN12292_c0_g1_i1.p4 TRINITY_DN12292_c0_g1~~TRINITY_DN12292_c0_g1_i1.p4  ORF type:complete len:135 (-),score=0.35 TRINITY_DN12292_c0_g1_i1:164-568(-)